MNVIATSCVPAVTCSGMFGKRFMSSARAGAPPVLMSAKSSSPPMSARNCSLRSTSTTSVCRSRRARVEARRRGPVSVMRYSPSAGNVCVNLMPPRVPSGMPGTYASCSPAGRREIRVATFGFGSPTARCATVARGVDVLLDERRRRAERGRDVREAVDLDLRRQVFLGVDLDVEQRLHGVGVLASVEALRRDVAARAAARAVDRALEARDEPVDLALRSGCGLPGGGISRPRSFTIAASNCSACWGTSSSVSPSNANRPRDRRRYGTRCNRFRASRTAHAREPLERVTSTTAAAATPATDAAVSH